MRRKRNIGQGLEPRRAASPEPRDLGKPALTGWCRPCNKRVSTRINNWSATGRTCNICQADTVKYSDRWDVLDPPTNEPPPASSRIQLDEDGNVIRPLDPTAQFVTQHCPVCNAQRRFVLHDIEGEPGEEEREGWLCEQCGFDSDDPDPYT